eukprot:TRINITY_DN32221_c0_g1_i1.p1 TRINITY_DN32221_c0_g1~~TRINITY_DN32221_c0_g1_i1.p1  ORF type:complete len:629 (+),score=204.41 TRINITY_DN32221_c0_g1_i1:109-1995(+)
MSVRPHSAHNGGQRNSRLKDYVGKERPFSAPSAAHALPVIGRDGGGVAVGQGVKAADPPPPRPHPRSAYAALPDAKAMGMVSSSKETSTLHSMSFASEDLSFSLDTTMEQRLEANKVFVTYDETLSGEAPPFIPINPLEEPEPKKMRRFLTTLASCRRLMRQAWGGKRTRHKLEKSFLVYEAEKLKETIAKADTLDLSLLTDEFWKCAEELISSAQSTVLPKTADASFAGCKSLITPQLVDAMNTEKPLARVKANTSFQHAAHVALPSEVTCSAMHPEFNILYTGCRNGAVCGVDLDSHVASPLPMGHVYPIAHILCTPLRRLGAPLSTYVVTAGDDKSVRLYNLPLRQMSDCFPAAHPGRVSAMCAWGGLLVTAGCDGTLHVWNVYRNQSAELIPKATIQADREDSVTALHPDGPLLLIGYKSGTVGVFVTPDMAALNSTYDAPPIRMCFKFDKADVVRRDIPVGAHEKALRGNPRLTMVWNIKQKKEPKAHLGAVTCLALRDDMCTLFTGGSDGQVVKWLLQHKQQSWKLKVHSLAVTSVLPMAKALLLTTSLDGLIKVWDDDKVMLVHTIHPMSREILSIRPTHYRVPQDPAAATKKTNKRVDQGQLVSAAAEKCLTLWDYAFQY